MDMLCLLFECPDRGVFVDAGGRPWGDEEIAAAIGGDIRSNQECIAELLAKGVAQRNARGAIFSRRMVRDEQERQAAKERKRKQRSLAGSPAKSATSDSVLQPGLFAERQTDEETSAVDRVARLHPANRHLENHAIPWAQRTAISEAIARDGEESVFLGTKHLAEAAAEWDPLEWRFIPNPVRFYQEADYLKRPEAWQRGRRRNTSEKCVHHPQAGFTDWGECWGCYGTKYVSGCQPA